MNYTFRRGQTITLAIDALEDADIVDSVVAKLRPLIGGKNILEPSADLAATFTVTERAESGDIPGGWNLVIDAATCATLDVGRYLADARLVIGTDAITTDSVVVTITEPATVTSGVGVP